ncbi:lysozyme inhibitor LprI family protein [Stagnihabitans tardus]|uniref:DUF1311 domain-containing protein n=1 Tax=Stagnihabitans tardus TaxID=2699202 RepID=A0AAE4YEP7_9RHOB|nr:lysozyme inhibitor LprI family protein [Stagnihabitans tardus]NBZ88754.1 DUF1311 domain-containing protein [Stagnihabitans tardus]
MRAPLLALALILPLPALANCADPVDQVEMTECAGQAYQAADEDLNATYKLAMAAMKAWDADLPKDQRGAEEALRKAQRAWLPYRDAVCENEVFFYKDGSIAPLVGLACLERLTRQRAEELRAMAEGE